MATDALGLARSSPAVPEQIGHRVWSMLPALTLGCWSSLCIKIGLVDQPATDRYRSSQPCSFCGRFFLFGRFSSRLTQALPESTLIFAPIQTLKFSSAVRRLCSRRFGCTPLFRQGHPMMSFRSGSGELSERLAHACEHACLAGHFSDRNRGRVSEECQPP